MRFKFFTITISLLIFCLPIQANSITDCSKIAAHPNDPDKIGAGIVYEDMQADQARDVCLASLQANPDSGVVLVGLARAFNKLENYSESVKYTKKAIDLDYPFAFSFLGTLHTYGEGVKKDPDMAYSYFLLASVKNVPVATRYLAQAYRTGDGVEKDLKRALQYSEGAIAQGDAGALKTAGLIYQELSENSNQPNIEIQKAIDAFRHANDNNINAHKELNQILAMQRPNRLSELPLLNELNKSDAKPENGGSNDSGKLNLNWYYDGKFSHGARKFLRAHTQVNDSVLALWYELPSKGNKPAWYIDFLYQGTHDLAKGYVMRANTSEIDLKNVSINLDAADMQLEALDKGYRITASLSYLDIEKLTFANEAFIGYVRTERNQISGFNFLLNDSRSKPGLSQVMQNMLADIRKQVPNCCVASAITPFSEIYIKAEQACASANKALKWKHAENTSRLILRSCYNDIKYASPSDIEHYKNYISEYERQNPL